MMVRLKEKVKRKLHVKEDDPPSITNKYGVCFKGLSIPKEEFSVPRTSTKIISFSASYAIEEKGKEKVSTPALTMIDLVGSGVEIHPNKEKSTSSDSSSHIHDYIALPRNLRDIDKDNVNSISTIQEEIKVSDNRIDESESHTTTSNVVMLESILCKNMNVVCPTMHLKLVRCIV